MEKGTRPVMFGEVLFDCFEDGQAELGGAPFNVAWHLQGFGLAPLLVSRIGMDPLGDQILERMRVWGMDSTGVQRDPDHPTGQVSVVMKYGQPHFTIEPEQAYDYIETEAALVLLREQPPALIYHGSLIERGAASRASLSAVKDAFRALPVFMDVNLRSPWWDRAKIRADLGRANWVKVNEDELAQLGTGPVSVEPRAIAMRERYDLDRLIVTRGAEGASLVDATGVLHGDPVPVDGLVDTVGAGDAFTSVILLGLIQQWPLPVTLQRALAFASAVCGLHGAVTEDREFYQSHLRQWNSA